MRISIPKTLNLLIQCWARAENHVSEQWADRSRNAGETFITEYFWQKLDKEFRTATERRYLAEAFEMDLCEACPALASERSQLHEISRELVMDCQLHNSAMETKSGGDFGLVVARPSLRDSYSGVTIRMKEQGLLCQAKLLSKTGRWGKLTSTQLAVLPPNLEFTALVLYRGGAPRSKLEPFLWQNCAKHTIDEVVTWLRKDAFPDTKASGAIIRSVASGMAGTASEHAIQNIILAEKRPQMRIRIDWPIGRRPEAIRVRQLQPQYALQQH